ELAGLFGPRGDGENAAEADLTKRHAAELIRLENANGAAEKDLAVAGEAFELHFAVAERDAQIVTVLNRDAGGQERQNTGAQVDRVVRAFNQSRNTLGDNHRVQPDRADEVA